MSDRRAWSEQEDKAILQLVKKYGNKRWALIAQKMIESYGLKGRSGKQCRQRWHNHLDNSINKDSWTQSQEKIIFQSHKKYGNKWTQIAKHLNGRTDNSIKNHFYSTLRKSLRRINKLIGSKNSTSQMRDIKPSVLSKIFSYAENDINELKQQEEKQLLADCKGLSQALLDFSILKRDKIHSKSHKQISEVDRLRFQTIINQILRFNNNYQKQKAQKLRIKKSLFYNYKSSSQYQQEQIDNESIIINNNKQLNSSSSLNNNTIKIQISQQQSEQNLNQQKTNKRIRKPKKIFEIQINIQNTKKSVSKNQSIKKLTYCNNPIEIQNHDLQNKKQFQKYLKTIKQVQNFKINQQQKLITNKIHSLNNHSQDDSFQEFQNNKKIINQLELNWINDNNIIQGNNFETPKLQYFLYSPKLPTPTNCFKSHDNTKYHPIMQNHMEQQIDKKMNSIKNQIILNTKKYYQQENLTSQNLLPSITFVPSPKSAFRRY